MARVEANSKLWEVGLSLMTKQWDLTCIFSTEALVYIIYTLVYSVRYLDPEQNTYNEISRNTEQIGLECETLFLYLRILPKDMIIH